jgi:hypothetical protein
MRSHHLVYKHLLLSLGLLLCLDLVQQVLFLLQFLLLGICHESLLSTLLTWLISLVIIRNVETVAMWIPLQSQSTPFVVLLALLSQVCIHVDLVESMFRNLKFRLHLESSLFQCGQIGIDVFGWEFWLCCQIIKLLLQSLLTNNLLRLLGVKLLFLPLVFLFMLPYHLSKRILELISLWLIHVDLTLRVNEHGILMVVDHTLRLIVSNGVESLGRRILL